MVAAEVFLKLSTAIQEGAAVADAPVVVRDSTKPIVNDSGILVRPQLLSRINYAEGSDPVKFRDEGPDNPQALCNLLDQLYASSAS